MYQLDNLTYEYVRGMPVVNGASAGIPQGLHLLLGENGAGKTTLLQLMAGILFPTSGACLYDGRDVSRRSLDTLGDIFFLPDNFECPFRSILHMARSHGEFYPHFSYELMYANLEDFGLRGDEPFKSLSLGMRRKSCIAYVLSLGVSALLLDEPANGMDIDSKKILRRMIGRSMTDENTIVVSTHNVHDLGSLFENVMIMHRGCLQLVMPVWRILERVAFVTSPSPVSGAIYQEPEQGRFKAIIPNVDGIETEIDYPLLYSAAMAPVGDSFMDYVKNAGND